jgi:hypothetical protein
VIASQIKQTIIAKVYTTAPNQFMILIKQGEMQVGEKEHNIALSKYFIPKTHGYNDTRK